MKVRFTARSVRARLDDLETEALTVLGHPQTLTVPFPGGHWTLTLQPGDHDRARGQGGTLTVTLGPATRARLADPREEGVELRTDDTRILVEKDYGPQHLT
ncbi:DUF7009 family protein [Deinococcus maricopensis]|uniref:Uncharacterized protein n=1 Tax=Deinococcus maricopensis (strain DSM 21211 / LMG 22137 / NRRL B-23946 / LB-34) TaxID=709986 RepID=E8UC62_DEIML|nr:hypothetical protein [Deinococcus maricopensis]ADV68723.1 hypothetical protein Deima_3094 [Deinococcus maricopensis DSM 21211]